MLHVKSSIDLMESRIPSGIVRLLTVTEENILVKRSAVIFVSDNVIGGLEMVKGTCMVHTTLRKRPMIRVALTVEDMEELLG